MANINHKWRKIVACGCSHGELANRDIQKQVLGFIKRFKPDIRVELGDLVDTATFRSGARGTPDEGRRPEPDEFAALRWLREYSPSHVTYGNHDWRLVQLQNSPNAIVSYAAGKLWTAITDEVRKLKARSRDYDFEKNWFEIGGTYWGHGFWYGMQALRDHAEFLGGPCVIAHLHHPQMLQGRTLRPSKSFCVGTLANIDSLEYARRRRQTATWAHGMVFGEVSDRSSKLWLASCEKGGTLDFPSV